MDKVQHRLFHFEAQPSAKVWENIEVSLDTDEQLDFPQKLKAYEVSPPINSWEKIEAALDKKGPVIIPFSKRFSKTFRYGGAAAILLIVATLFINKKSTIDGLSNSSDSSTGETNYFDRASIGGETNDFVTKANSHEATNSPQYSEKGNNSILIKSSVVLPRHSVKTSFNHTDKIIIPKNIPVVKTDMPERYIVFSNNSGEVFRLSKKLFDLFACADDTENCRRNIEWVQQQMAAPDRMASADFGDVLEMLRKMNYQ